MAELEATMSARELSDWARLEANHQPLPDRLSDLHFALLCSVLVNLQRPADSQPLLASDFMVIRDRKPPPPDDGLNEVDRQMLNWRGG